MSIKRITISVPEEVAARLKAAAGSTPVSAWVTSLIEEHLDEAELDRLWEEFYHDVSPGRDAIRKADAILKRSRRRGVA